MDRPRDLTLDVDLFSADAKKRSHSGERIIAEAGQERHPSCLICGKAASVWIIQMAYPFAENKLIAFGPLDYPGPIPGFCWRHDKEGAEAVAGGVFFDQPVVQMAKPTEWFATFHDGSQMSGHILSAVPEGLKVEVQESYAPKEDLATE